jgi:hypothetical protein
MDGLFGKRPEAINVESVRFAEIGADAIGA